MGVLNVTPDSFSDGGLHAGIDSALDRARVMVAEGADIIDVGGESTRPGAAPVSVAEECRRVIPVVEAIAAELSVTLSVDTSTPEVMTAAAAAGAGLINDVRALQRPGALEAAAATGLPVCLMHMQGQPDSMQQAPAYDDVVGEVEAYLLERAAVAEGAGIARQDILLDPGFGFGKTLAHNLALLNALPRLAAHGYPVLAGLSRKSMLGTITGRDVDQRLAGSLALALLAAQGGAAVIRVHDVGETRDVLRVLAATSPPDSPRE
ncbi:dihydropteroate synthase [Marinihelvus fidelis]|uniref:dihydropteroate synthase n=1 Tax=Marinihelvus fidelis TaxID=2613842 RepID=A0A5N0TEF7_9GAMM|nr:dihydropteroate synthase [Marinihelvus fidelis]KAA9132477.1 dihydropteroate synthase [Marinihelvus fidelis]